MASFADIKKKIALERASTAGVGQASVSLPSNGDKVIIRPMKVKEQKEFLKAFEKQDEFLINEAFDKILESCVESVNGELYDGDNICVQDRIFLLIKIRQLTSGDKIKIAHVIGDTDEKGKNKVEQVEIDLTTLKVDTFEGDNIQGEIEVSSTIKVILGPVTRKTEKQLEAWIKKKNAKDSLIDRRYAAYASLIKQILQKNEETGAYEKVDATFDQLVEFITDVCTEKEIKKIEEYAGKLDFGIRLSHPVSSKDGTYNNEKEELSLLSFFIQ